jgi:hypothetical protein
MAKEKKGVQNRRPGGKTYYGPTKGEGEAEEQQTPVKKPRKIHDIVGDYTLVYPLRENMTRDYLNK